MTTTTPWLERDEWSNGRIRAQHVNLNLYAQLIGFVVSGLIVIPLNIAKWDRINSAAQQAVDSRFRQFDGHLMLAFLLLMVALQIPLVIRAWFRWRKARTLRLTLEPYPGRIGGRVAGRLDLPDPLPTGITAVVEINCIRDTRGRSASQRVLWRRSADTRILAGPTGSQIQFSVAIDADQPESSLRHVEESRNLKVANDWVVRVQIPDRGFDDSFRIPVFRIGADGPQANEEEAQPQTPQPPRQAALDALPAHIVKVTASRDGFTIDYPPGRERFFGRLLLAFGLGADLFALFMLVNLYEHLSGGSTSHLGLMIDFALFLGMTFFGNAMLLGGLYFLRNRLEVRLEGDTLTITRHFFHKRFTKTVHGNEIHGFEKRISTQTDQGAHSEIEYAIRLNTRDGRSLTVGDGIAGDRNADLLIDFLSSRLPHQPSDGRRFVEEAPPWLKPFLASTFLIGALLFVGTIVAFVADRRG